MDERIDNHKPFNLDHCSKNQLLISKWEQFAVTEKK